MKVKLGDLVEFSNGYAFKSSDYVDCSNTVNCRMSNIRPDGSFDIEYNIKFLPDEFSDKYSDFILKDGDIVIAMTDMAGDPKILGIPTIVSTKGYTVLMNQRVGKLALKSELIIPQYLKYTLISKPARDYFKSFAGGGVQLNIGKKEILNIELNLHNLEEQTEIVNRLDKIKIIIEFRKQQLQQLDELAKARFVEMFGEPETNPYEWRKDVLAKHLNVVGGYAFKSELFEEKGIPVLRIGNINAGFFQPINMVYWKYDESLSRYMMHTGDLVMSLTGTVGKDDYGNVCILGDDYDCYYLNQRNAKLELFSTLNKYYLSQVLKFSEVKRKLTGISRGVRQANISNKDILNLEIPIPPIELQNEFAAFVEQVDKSKVAVQKALDEAQTLFDSLMQEYFG